MAYKEYVVRIWDDGDKYWYVNDKSHREDGPAVELANGTKRWFIKGKEYTKPEFDDIMNKPGCDGKVVLIDGVKYKLMAV
jgi:hypothetical protein